MQSRDDNIRHVPLDDLTVSRTPITYGVVKPGIEGDVLFIRSGDILDGQVQIHQLRTITRQVAEQYRRTRLEGGEIVVSLVGSPGQVATVPDSLVGANVARQVGLIRLKPEVDSQYVKYFLMSPQGKAALGSRAKGSVQSVINLGDLKTIRIPLPPLPEQKRIAHILGTLDDKIELNRRMNATLEAMARALFKAWFVDFDPVRAKAAGRDPGLPADIAALFPAALVESELGEVPEGWGVGRLAEHVSVSKGLSYKGAGLTTQEYGLPMHNLNSVLEGGGYKYDGLKWYSGEFKERHVVKPGDLIVTNTEQGFQFLLIGFPAIVPECFGDMGLFSHHIFKMVPNEGSPLSRLYLYHLLRTSQYHDLVAGFTNGTTVNMLPTDGLQMPPVLVPPSGLVAHFDAFAKAALARIEQSHVQNQTLAALRDTLLPRLLAGEVRVATNQS